MESTLDLILTLCGVVFADGRQTMGYCLVGATLKSDPESAVSLQQHSHDLQWLHRVVCDRRTGLCWRSTGPNTLRSQEWPCPACELSTHVPLLRRGAQQAAYLRDSLVLLHSAMAVWLPATTEWYPGVPEGSLGSQGEVTHSYARADRKGLLLVQYFMEELDG